MNSLDSLMVKATSQLRALQQQATRRLVRGDSERGSITVEQILWVVAMVALVGIVVAAITAFINTQVGKIA